MGHLKTNLTRFVLYFLVTMLLPVTTWAGTVFWPSNDTIKVSPYTAAGKTYQVILINPGAWMEAFGRVEVDTIKSNSGATIVLQGNFTDAAGTRQNFSHVQIDSFSSDSVTVTGNGVVTGNFAIQGGTTIGNASGDALTFHPNAWTLTNAVTITGTWTNLGTVTTVDINGGTADGVTIGGASAAAGTFTTLKADSTWFGSGDVIVAPTQNEMRLASGVYFNNSGSEQMFKIANTERMRLNATGLGVSRTGTMALEKLLHVSGDSVGGGYILIETEGPFASTDSATIGFRHYDDTGDAAAAILLRGTGYSGDIVFKIRDSGTSGAGGAILREKARITPSGNFVVGLTALATTATDGFLYIPGGTGPPTGAPTSYPGRYALYVDSTNHKLYFYDGAWRDAGP